MELYYIAAALGSLGVITLGFMFTSYRKSNDKLDLIVGLIHQSSKEFSSVGSALGDVIQQNNTALEQQKKGADHQRVLLASLNRQLVTLEALYDKTQANSSSKPASTQSASQKQAIKQDVSAPQNKTTAQENTFRRSSGPMPLNKIFNHSDNQSKGTGARIPLEQRLRLQQHLQNQAAVRENPELKTMNNGAAIQTRDTIDLLNLDERRVVNG